MKVRYTTKAVATTTTTTTTTRQRNNETVSETRPYGRRTAE